MNLQNISQSFLQALTSSQTQKTSLPFIKHTLSSHPIVKPGEEFQTLTIGGSICQSDRMKVNETIHSLNHKMEKQPPFLSEQDFLTYIEKLIDPKVSVVGLNFAYPLEPIQRNGVLDGKLVSGSKENTFDGFVGKMVGETIEQHIKEKRGQTIRVSVANDTICLLLSGLTKHPWNQLAAGIVGTGMNFAIFLDETTAVNLEAANFNEFKQTPEGKEIDQSSVAPGDSIFEKEVSGAYLYKHFNIIAQHRGIDTRISGTDELDKLAVSENTKEGEIAREVLNRSAQFVACQVAGILEFQKRDITFVMQGSLFWKGYHYRETVEKTVKELTRYNAHFEQIENADLLGAAKLVV